MEEEKVYQTNHTKITVLVTVLILCIVCSVGAVYMMIRANNIKQEQLRASDRIEQLFDSVAEVENFESESDYDKYTDKLDEVKTLMNENKLNDKYEKKLNELNLYLSDLKTLLKIEKLYTTFMDEKSFIEINQEFNKLTDEKVIKKAVSLDLDYQCEKYILAKYFYAAQNHIKNEDSNNYIRGVYSYNAATDTKYYGSDVGVEGIVDYYCDNFTDIYDYTGPSVKYLNNEIKDNVRSNGQYAICVDYTDGEGEKNISYWYLGFEVKSTLKPGGVRYNVTKYTEGVPSVSNDLSFDDLKDYYVSIQ